jgi:hypothetical protein
MTYVTFQGARKKVVPLLSLDSLADGKGAGMVVSRIPASGTGKNSQEKGKYPFPTRRHSGRTNPDQSL